MKTALSGLKTVSGYGEQKAKTISDIAYLKALREGAEKDENGVFTSEDSIKIRQTSKNAEKRQNNYSL
ncbi:MAG: hypothetical protein IJM02_07000 [Clostridia bacterium]|nr:hypothetical protein [Clostridia bacterium]